MAAPQDCAYAAGFLDGEGCVYATHSKHRGRLQLKVYVRIYNTDPRPLIWMVEKFGGHIRQIPKQKNVHKQCYYWYVLGSSAIEFMKSVREYVHVKGEQIDLAIQLRERCGLFPKGIRIPSDEIVLRDSLVSRVKSLKHEVVPLRMVQ